MTCIYVSNHPKSLKMRRCFAIDIDKTFYIEDSTKFEKNIESFKELNLKQIVPFFCTGRTKPSAMSLVGDDFVRRTGYNGFPGVYSNGAIVYDQNGTIISHTIFSKGFLQKFIAYLLDNNLDGQTIFSEAEGFYTLKELDDDFRHYPKEKNMKSVTVISPEELSNKSIISININRETEINELADMFTTKVCTNDKTFHISPRNITKAFGVRKLLDHLGLPYDQCSFIGNGENDIELLEFCKSSYAVGNANTNVKRAAKTVLKEDYDKGAFQKAVKLITAP